MLRRTIRGFIMLIIVQEPPTVASDRGGNQAKREARGERNRARGLLIIRYNHSRDQISVKTPNPKCRLFFKN
jgi:hypothetical protein